MGFGDRFIANAPILAIALHPTSRQVGAVINRMKQQNHAPLETGGFSTGKALGPDSVKADRERSTALSC
jgi:hypothetical protein